MKILFLGGRTGGHILPLRPLAEIFSQKQIKVEFVFADQPLDKNLTRENFSEFPVSFIKAGKIRRHFSFRNFFDFFYIFFSFFRARSLLKKINPDVLFFKGGFVGFPFFIAAKFFLRFKGKIYCHESDIPEGILNRIVSRFSDYSFKSFGNPAYPLFFKPKKIQKILFDRKMILVFGGSQGAIFINHLLEKNLPVLLAKYRVILISGEGKKIQFNHPFFEQYDFLSAQKLSDFLHSADFVVSRAGANSLFEIISAQKPSIIIPLPSVARNHQFLNAQFFSKKGLCVLLEQDDSDDFLSVLESAMDDLKLKQNLLDYSLQNAAERIVEIVLQKNKIL